MTAQEAIAILDRAASMAPLTRADHIAVAQAKVELEKFIESHTPPPKDQEHA